MKKLSILLVFFILATSCKGNDNKKTDSLTVKSDKQEIKLKRYEVKSAIVDYKTTINGSVMGSTIKGSGTEHLYFKDWGNVELKEAESTQTTHTKILGQENTETTNTHTMYKLDNGKSYSVDFKKKKIFLNRDAAMEMVKMFGKGDVNKTGKQMLEGMGGKIVGKGKVLDYNCDIWDVMGAKQWIYKGLPLKLEVTMMGITTTTEATSAKFNIPVSDKYFKLPDFPVQKEEGYRNNEEFEEDIDEMHANMDKLEKMSYKEWKKIAIAEDEEMQNMSEEELRQTYNMMQKMIKMRKGK